MFDDLISTVNAAPFRTLEMPRSVVREVLSEDGSRKWRNANSPYCSPAPLFQNWQRALRVAPDRCFLAERLEGSWRRITYSQAERQIASVAKTLREHRRQGPVLAIGENSIDYAIVILAALREGTTIVPVSPAYALLSRELSHLRSIVEEVKPTMAFVGDYAKFGAAVKSVGIHERNWINVETNVTAVNAIRTGESPDVESHERPPDVNTDPHHSAAILYTSGTTGAPRGVRITETMLGTVLRMLEMSEEPRDPARPDVVLDWLPFHHIYAFGVNLFGLINRCGTLYIDDGKPVPALFERSIANLRGISPTLYVSVPSALAMLADRLEQDAALCDVFFRNLKFISYGGAALPQNTFDRLQHLSVRSTGLRIPIISGWGMTETCGLGLQLTWCSNRADLIGLPSPGSEVKLIPQDSPNLYELRVGGPNVTPGYINGDKPGLRDDDGFMRTGDLVALADPSDANQGLVYAGRIAEEFKLLTGTWVKGASLRTVLVDLLAPLARDVVLVAPNRPYLGLLIWPNLDECQKLCADRFLDGLPTDFLRHPALEQAFRERLEIHNATAPGSSARIARFLLLTTPPSLDRGELTAKMSISPSTIRRTRSADVDALYADPLLPHVVVLE